MLYLIAFTVDTKYRYGGEKLGPWMVVSWVDIELRPSTQTRILC